jgi:hypothetical protein
MQGTAVHHKQRFLVTQRLAGSGATKVGGLFPSMGDRYGKLVEDVGYRQDQVKRVGLGWSFKNRYLGYVGYKFWRLQ